MNKRIILGMDGWWPQIDGVCLTVKNYYEQLTADGNDCSVIVPSYGKKQDLAADVNSQIAAYHGKRISVPVGGYSCAMPAYDRRLKKLLGEFRPEILHSHSPFNIGEYFAQYAKKHDVPSIYTFHTKFKEEFKRVTSSKTLTKFLTEHIVKVINKQDRVWTVCNGMIDVLRDYGYKGDVTVIRNGTDMTMPDNPDELITRVNEQFELTDCENVMLFVGRVVTVKNLQLIFNALKTVKQKSSMPFKLVIVGNGDDMELHKKMVNDLDIADNVVFAGEILDREFLKGFYLRADLFVFPSVFDAFSLCPLEAATFSLPTLLIKDSSTGETVTDNVSGFCEEKDHVAWANRIIEIFKDKKRLTEIGQGARKFVYRSWQDVVKEVEQHYDNILAGKE